MDTRLIFRDHQNTIKTDGGTQTVSLEEEWLRIQVKGGPDRQIRRFVCQENPLRSVR
jgi:16S rRNA U516 pseudouridylate synthase RsuA-like enzyme